MKLLQAFEWMAMAMIISGVVLGLGKVAADQIVSLPARPITASVAVVAPSYDEKARYLAGLKRSVQLMEAKMSAEMEARARGDR